ncbi:hypothetical protein K1T71_002623 [Dendrolimus kikuchii]|uniref:Uncharacterized protein n=1 Tax=Dendrolimus kikuchii TaxID=765133 RepID=A0ACC1DDH8_9NEOP|nr:hypothetical protein K1T71_002623 [Dendrolimus kikuchii]
MIARDVKFHESPNTRKDISKQEPSLLNITKDGDQDFIEIDFTKSNVPVEERRHEAEEVDNMQDIWSECQEYPAECDEDVSSSRRLQVEQQAEETRHDTLDQLRMTTRAPGRPRILRTGSVGRPKKIYQTREVERSVTSTDANEVEDFAGSTEITLKNALKMHNRTLRANLSREVGRARGTRGVTAVVKCAVGGAGHAAPPSPFTAAPPRGPPPSYPQPPAQINTHHYVTQPYFQHSLLP